MFDIEQIKSRIKNIINTKKNLFEIYVINLEHRKDRLDHILNEFNKNNNSININVFNAYKNEKGYIGCGMSHLSLIYYAKELNLPYIIVIEDDNKLLINIKTLIKILSNLQQNLDKWEIFNSNPTFWNKRYGMEYIKKYNSEIKNFYHINSGQTTNFMIYNKMCYNKMLKYDFSNHIDEYISENFIQTTYSNYICTQLVDKSDIHNFVNNNEYEEYFKYCSDFYKNLSITNLECPIKFNTNNSDNIGICVLLLNNNEYEKFINSFEKNFLISQNKTYYIFTNNKDIKPLNNKTIINYINNDKLYFNNIYENILKIDIINNNILYICYPNILINNNINEEILPSEKNKYILFNNNIILGSFSYNIINICCKIKEIIKKNSNIITQQIPYDLILNVLNIDKKYINFINK